MISLAAYFYFVVKVCGFFYFEFFFTKQGVHLGLPLLISERHRFGSETKRLFTDL